MEKKKLSPSTLHPPSAHANTRPGQGVRVDLSVFPQKSTRVFVTVKAGYSRGHQNVNVLKTMTMSVALKSIS